MPDSTELKFDRLRELAEDLLQKNGNTADEASDEITHLLHELRVHQVELSIQNEELQSTQDELVLSRQNYADLFDYAPIAYFVIDKEGIIEQVNLTAVAKFGTTRQALFGTMFPHLVAMLERDHFYKWHRTLVKERRPKKLEVWFKHRGIEPFYGSMEVVVVDDDNESPKFRLAITDITERKIYEERLEAIHKLDQAILMQSDIDEVIEITIGQLWRSTECSYIAVILFEKHDHQTHYFIRDNKDEEMQRYGRLKQVKADALTTDDMTKWQDQHPRIVRKPSFLARETGRNYPTHLFVPISRDNELKGLIDLGAEQEDDFDNVSKDFIQQLTSQLGIGVQQAEYRSQIQRYTVELEAMVDERTIQLRDSQDNEHRQRVFAEGLLTIVKQINQSLDLERVLEQILINLEIVVQYEGAQIIITHSDSSPSVVQSRGKLQLSPETVNSSLLDDNRSVYMKMARTGEPVLIPEEAHQYICVDEASEAPIEAYLGVPIQSQSEQQLLGYINLYGAQVGFFDNTDTMHLQAFAEHVSIAVKNARLYQKGQELAALEERQRLARDLHDAVSQLIFSLGIMAETLPNLLRKEKFERADAVAETMRTIAASAHAEMRLLLLELRPMNLERIGLEDLLQQLVIAFLGRHSALNTNLQADSTPPLSIKTKSNLYRIVQEALNNIGKHAEAQNIEIKLWVDDDVVNLTVTDDGRGYDTSKQSAGQGMHMMQDRAAIIGAEYTISSQIGQGTRIHVRCEI